MELPARRQPPTVRLRRLAAELRKLREEVKLTREDVSEHTGINMATVYRIETAKVRPQKRTLMAMLDMYNVTNPKRRAELVALSKPANELGWLRDYGPELSEGYATYISFEADARSVRNFETLFVPGLLQTEDYAHAVIKGELPQAPTEDISRRVQARLNRQDILTKSNPLNLWAILDEAVLHRVAGSSQIMIDQLRYLAEAASAPNLTLQVIPYSVGIHPGMVGPFVVMDFPDDADPDLVYVENVAGELLLDGPENIRRFTEIFAYLQALALNPDDSVHLIIETAEIFT